MTISTDVQTKALREHADLIHLAVIALAVPENLPKLEELLIVAEQNGWGTLVSAIRKIIGGVRDEVSLGELDGEDSAIVSAILQGIDDPSSLPELSNLIDPMVAGRMLAGLIMNGAAGDETAQQRIVDILDEFSKADPGLEALAGRVARIVAGERDEIVLCQGVTEAGASVVKAVLAGLDIQDSTLRRDTGDGA